MTRLRPSANWDDLAPEVQQEILHGVPAHTPPGGQHQIRLGPASPLLGWDEQRAKNVRAASERSKTGKSFEDDLRDVHALYAEQAKAFVERNHAETIGRHGARRFVAGGAPVDYDGTLAIPPWRGRSVRFDAKCLGKVGGPTYEHEHAQRHQLSELARHQAAGALSFLLVQDPLLQVAYCVTDFAELLKTRTVRLRAEWPREGPKRISVETRRAQLVTRWPLVVRPMGVLVRQDEIAWDWLTALVGRESL